MMTSDWRFWFWHGLFLAGSLYIEKDRLWLKQCTYQALENSFLPLWYSGVGRLDEELWCWGGGYLVLLSPHSSPYPCHHCKKRVESGFWGDERMKCVNRGVVIVALSVFLSGWYSFTCNWDSPPCSLFEVRFHLIRHDIICNGDLNISRVTVKT